MPLTVLLQQWKGNFSFGADFYAVKPNAYTDLKNLVKIVFQTHWGAAEPRDRVFHVP